MSLTTITGKELAKIQKLVERKEELMEQIAGINAELSALESETPVQESPAKPAAHRKPAPRAAKSKGPAVQENGGATKTRRGGLKERVINELKSAGPQGVKVADLAAKLNSNYDNISAFFKGTAKKIPEISKVSRGRWAWREW
jgi:hypothetical protein